MQNQWEYWWELCLLSCSRTIEHKVELGIKPPGLWLADDHEEAAATPRCHCTDRNLGCRDLKAIVSVWPAENLYVQKVVE